MLCRFSSNSQSWRAVGIIKRSKISSDTLSSIIITHIDVLKRWWWLKVLWQQQMDRLLIKSFLSVSVNAPLQNVEIRQVCNIVGAPGVVPSGLGWYALQMLITASPISFALQRALRKVVDPGTQPLLRALHGTIRYCGL
jgi:hypothetical protein